MADIQSIVTGSVWKIEKQAGHTVAAGDCIMIMESMKMEIPIEATRGGVLRELFVKEGDSVTEGDVVAQVG